MKLLKTNKIQKVNGLTMIIQSHQTNPIPFSFLPQASFLRHFQQAVALINTGDQVLEMGAGAGLWGLLCLQKGAFLSASDLEGIDLSSIVESAKINQFPIPQLYHGDLFSDINLQGKVFDSILFNPPFHLGQAKNLSEQAYLGGTEGGVILRFLDQAPHYLKNNAYIYMILPDIEYQYYRSTIQKSFEIEVKYQQWIPLLGSCLLLQLCFKQAWSEQKKLPLQPTKEGYQTQSLSDSAEIFYHLSKLINTHSCEIIDIQGQLDVKLLRKSIYDCCLRHPITRSKLKKKKFHQGYAWEIDQGFGIEKIAFEQKKLELPSFSLSEGQMNGALLAEVWSGKPLDPFIEYPIKFKLIETEYQLFFMVIAPHLCTDARAGILLAYQILDRYQSLNQSELKEWQTIHQLTAIPDTSQALLSKIEPFLETSFISHEAPLSLHERPLALKLILLWQASLGILYDLLIKAQGLGLPKKARGNTQIYSRSIEAPAFAQLKSIAKTKGLTIHQVLQHALLRAQAQWKEKYLISQSRRIRLADLYQVSHEFKNKDQLNQSFNILVTPYTLTIDLSQSEARQYSSFSKKLLGLKQGLSLVELYRLKIYLFWARRLPISWIQKLMELILKTEITTTNPGIIPFDFYWENSSFKVKDVLNFPQISPPAKLGIIYTTFRQRLRLVFIYDDQAITQDQLQALQGLFLKEIGI